MLSEELFESLKELKEVGQEAGSTDQRLIRYCKEVLGTIEGLHVDFKEKHDRRQASLDLDDKRNLACAVSGFANSSGGVLIWGIENATLKPKPIANASQFVSLILELAPQVTDPVVANIEGAWLPSDEGGKNSGFAFIHVPESPLPPHRVILRDKDIGQHYYVRSGDSFVIAPHYQLEDMFGRRPRPQLALQASARVEVASKKGGTPASIRIVFRVTAANTGRGVARLACLSLATPVGLDPVQLPGIPPVSSPLRRLQTAPGWWVRIAANDDEVIYAEDEMQMCTITFHYPVNGLPQADVQIGYSLAAERTRAIRGEIRASGSDIYEASREVAGGRVARCELKTTCGSNA